MTNNDDEEQAAVELSRKIQLHILSEINAGGFSHAPYVVLHALIELSGALAGACLQHDGARVDVLLGMVNALQARVERDASVFMPVDSEVRH